MISDRRLQRSYAHSRLNRQFMTPGTACRCFHCLRVFPADEISHGTDDGKTALCPHCGVDSVLPGGADQLTDDPIRQLHATYFSGPAKKLTAEEWRVALAEEQAPRQRPRAIGAD